MVMLSISLSPFSPISDPSAKPKMCSLSKFSPLSGCSGPASSPRARAGRRRRRDRRKGKRLGRGMAGLGLRDAASAGQRAFGRRDGALLTRIKGERCAQGAGKALERGFRNVMGILPIERFHVDVHRGMGRKGLKKLAHEIGIEVSDLGPCEFRLEDKEGPSRDIH